MLGIFLAGGGTPSPPDLVVQVTSGSLSEWLVAIGTLGLAIVAGWPYIKGIFQKTIVDFSNKVQFVREIRHDDLAGRGQTNKLNLTLHFYNPRVHAHHRIQTLSVRIEDQHHIEVAQMVQFKHFEELAPTLHEGKGWASPIYLAPLQAIHRGVQFISKEDIILKQGRYTIKLYMDNEATYHQFVINVTKSALKKLYENRGADSYLVDIDTSSD